MHHNNIPYVWDESTSRAKLIEATNLPLKYRLKRYIDEKFDFYHNCSQVKKI